MPSSREIGERSPKRATVLALAVCAPLLLGSAPAAFAADAGGTPAAVFDAANHSQDVYYEAPGGSLQEMAWTPSTGFRGPYLIAGPGTLASAPAATFDPENRSQDIYYRAPNGALARMAWTPSTGFQGPYTVTVTGAGTVASAPAAIFDPENHSQDIYYQAPNGALEETAWTPSTGFRSPYTVTGAGTLASAPAATFDPGNHSQDVYFGTPGRSLQVMVWTPATSFVGPYAVTGPGTLASAPAATFDSENHSEDVYYQAPGRSLQEMAWTPTSGFRGPYAITGAGTVGPGPSSAGGGSTAIPPPPPAKRGGQRRQWRLNVKIVIHWSWNHARTRLDRATFAHLPRRARVTITCRGRGCPMRAESAGYRRIGRLSGRVFRAGDTLALTVSSPRYVAERIRVVIRNGRKPKVRML